MKPTVFFENDLGDLIDSVADFLHLPPNVTFQERLDAAMKIDEIKRNIVESYQAVLGHVLDTGNYELVDTKTVNGERV